MPIIDILIMSACMGLSGNQNDACVKALTAGSKQTGVEKMANDYEFKQSQELQKEAYEWLGKDKVDAIGIMAGTGQAVSSRRISLGLPNFGICDGMKFEFNNSTSQIILNWKF